MPALRLAHLTDIHLESLSAVALLRDRVLAIQKEFKPDAFVITGDMVRHEPNDWLVIGPAYQRLWQLHGIAVFHCPGNHDIYIGGGEYDTDLYESYCGPENYVREFKGFSIVGLNVLSGQSQAALKQRIEDVKQFGCNEQWPSAATPTPRELTLLRKKSAQRPMIVLQHLVPNQPDLQRYAAQNVCAVFSGHWHATKFQQYQRCNSYNGANPLFGGIDGSPAGFIIVDFKADGSNSGEWHPMVNSCTFAVSKKSDHVWTKQLQGSIERADLQSDGERLYISSFYRDRYQHTSYALNLKDGSVAWQRKTSQGIRRSLCPSNDLLIGNGYDGMVTAFEKQSGRIRWQAPLGNGSDRFLNSSPCLDRNGHLLVGNAHTFMSVNVEDGSIRWSKRLCSEFATTSIEPIYDASSHTILVPQQWAVLSITLNDNKKTGIHAILDADTGENIFVHNHHSVEAFSLTPCIHDGIIYSSNKSLIATRYLTDDIIWRRDAFEIPSGTLQMCKQGLLFPRVSGSLSLIDPKNGDEIWSLVFGPTDRFAVMYNYESLSTCSGIYERGPHLYFTAMDGYVYKVLAKTGKVVHQVALGAASLSTPVWTDSGIVCADFNAHIHCLKHF